ncbi:MULTISPECIES: hypothetical protein [unclassified Streptomyces]|uniref:hypothetical protein n=1 Tax=unclassified Streptomyces TaxID=2593676 RepID=UPI0038736DD7
MRSVAADLGVNPETLRNRRPARRTAGAETEPGGVPPPRPRRHCGPSRPRRSHRRCRSASCYARA